MIGQGYRDKALSETEVGELLQALEVKELAGKRVLVIIPDGTRTAPIALFFRLLYERLGPRVKRLDYLIALGTHQQMTDAAIAKLVGAGREERALRYPKSEVSNHRWELPETLIPIGTIPAAEMDALTGGLVADIVLLPELQRCVAWPWQVHLNTRIPLFAGGLNGIRSEHPPTGCSRPHLVGGAGPPLRPRDNPLPQGYELPNPRQRR
jgi:hypothetical protein